MDNIRYPFGKFTGNPPKAQTRGTHTCPATGKKSYYGIISVDGDKFTIRFDDDERQTRHWRARWICHGQLNEYVTEAFDREGKQ